MAGFAVNIKLLHQFPNATFVYKVGFEEDSFLQEIVTDVGFIEAKAANCTQVKKFNLVSFNLSDTKLKTNLILFGTDFSVAHSYRSSAYGHVTATYPYYRRYFHFGTTSRFRRK
jgi:hypothetical protein